MLDHIIVALIGAGILGAAYLLDLIVGIAKVAFTPDMKWSWAKFAKDLFKALLIGVGIVGFVAILDALTWYGTLAGADLTVLAGTSFPALIAAIIGGCAWYLGNTFKNIVSFVNSKNVAVTIDEKKLEENTAAIALEAHNVAELFQTLTQTEKKVVEEHKEFEEEGGQGASYTVPIGSYDDFRNTVLGKGYDIDGAYGAQCWDGAALLWQQLGRTLSTGGTGAAKDCWTVARNANAGAQFNLVTDFNSLKRGDVIVYGYGQYGHIAFVDQVNPLRILGQNQTGSGNGAPFNVINATSNGFLGAFRYRGWNKAPVTPPVVTPPTPKPTPKPSQDLTQVVAAVRRGDYGNEPERSQKLRAAGYDPAAVQAAVNAQIAAENAAKPQQPAVSSIAVGDTVTAWGAGTAASDGSGGSTKNFTETPMKVIRIVNGRLALNQYNQGTPENAADVTGWWPLNQVRK